jgi:hypothetical protein
MIANRLYGQKSTPRKSTSINERLQLSIALGI